jgi:hypothetical protein
VTISRIEIALHPSGRQHESFQLARCALLAFAMVLNAGAIATDAPKFRILDPDGNGIALFLSTSGRNHND